MPRKKQPGDQAELQHDIDGHPDRGKVNGEEIFRTDSVDLRSKIPRELHREFLLILAALGLGKSEGVEYAIQRLVSDPGLQLLKENFIRRKMEQYQSSYFDVYSKVLGAFKARGRAYRLQAGVDAKTDSANE